MADFSKHLSCSIGPATFQLIDYSLTSTPDLESRFGLEIGRKIELSGEGEIAGDDATDFADKVRSGIGSFEVSGQSLWIKGLGGKVEYELLSTRCWQGPNITVTVEKQGSGQSLVKRFSFRATATVCYVVDPVFGASDSRTCGVSERPDGLRTVAYKGTLRGGTNLEGAFNALVRDPLTEAYPWPNWQLRIEREYAGQYGTPVAAITYTVTAEEMLEVLPGVKSLPAQETDAWAVDGQYGYRKEYDELRRLTITESYDLLMGGGSVADMETIIRPKLIKGERFLRESFEFSGIRERRVRAQYTWAGAGAASGLMEWEENFERQVSAYIVNPVNFEGAASIAVWGSSTIMTLRQSGRAVSAPGTPELPAAAPAAPAPVMLDGWYFAALPVIRTRSVPGGMVETSWQYEMATVEAVDETALAEAIAAELAAEGT